MIVNRHIEKAPELIFIEAPVVKSIFCINAACFSRLIFFARIPAAASDRAGIRPARPYTACSNKQAVIAVVSG